jgi:nucleoside-diphosphate-sugar epimerase
LRPWPGAQYSRAGPAFGSTRNHSDWLSIVAHWQKKGYSMKVLVTGGAGFIGSNLVHELLRRDHTVVVLDNLATGKRDNLKGVMGEIEFIEGDICDYHLVRKAVDGVEVIMHEAALGSVPRSIRDPITTNNVNIGGTLNILHAARDGGVRRVVYASSSSVYGDTPKLPKHEEMPTNPLSPYAISKLGAELYCRVFSRVYGMETVSLRYFNVFGPRQDPASQYAAVIPRFITALLRGEQPVIFGDGEQTRDFTYIDNVVHANMLAATSESESGLALNCACHDRTSLNTLVKMCNGALGTNIHPRYDPPRAGDVRDSFAAIDLAHRVIGYKPVVDFRTGLQKTADWYRSCMRA